MKLAPKAIKVMKEAYKMKLALINFKIKHK